MSAWLVAPEDRKSPNTRAMTGGLASWVTATSVAIHRHASTDELVWRTSVLLTGMA
jgi:hypothetical protein